MRIAWIHGHESVGADSPIDIHTMQLARYPLGPLASLHGIYALHLLSSGGLVRARWTPTVSILPEGETHHMG